MRELLERVIKGDRYAEYQQILQIILEYIREYFHAAVNRLAHDSVKDAFRGGSRRGKRGGRNHHAANDRESKPHKGGSFVFDFLHA